MKFVIIRHKTHRNLVVRKDCWGSGIDYNFLDKLGSCDPEKYGQCWIDVSNPKSFTVDSKFIQFSCDFDFYKGVRKTLRYDVQDFVWRSRPTASGYSPSGHGAISHTGTFPTKYNGFVLNKQLEQEKFWHRLNKELDIEVYRIDILSQQLTLVETLEFKDDRISPKKISHVS